MSAARDAKSVHGIVGVTLLESGRHVGPWQAAKTAIGMAAHLSVVAGFVVFTSVDYRQAREDEPDLPRPIFLAPEKRPLSAPVQERLSQVALSESPDVGDGEELAPAEESAPADAMGSDEVAEITVPAPGLDEFVLTEIEVDSAVIPDPSSGGPTYPLVLLDAGIEGQVLVRFIVDTTGRAVEESYLALQSTHSAFTQAVKDALPLMKFRPARLAGTPVPQLVVQSFSFRIADPRPLDSLGNPVPTIPDTLPQTPPARTPDTATAWVTASPRR